MDLLLLGLGLGLAAGVSPGPLLALVVTSTLERGFGAGLRVALAPLLTDTPIILLALTVLRGLSPRWLALLGGIGGCVVIALGIDTLRKRQRFDPLGSPDSSSHRYIVKGAIVNLLNPHPWVFWITVQGPTVLLRWQSDPAGTIAYVGSFYAAMVGSKVMIAWMLARGRGALDRPALRWALLTSGLLLIGLGGWLMIESLSRVTGPVTG